LAAGLRTPFVAVDGPFAHRDSLALSVPVLQAMAPRVTGPIDFAIWGSVVRNLAYANLAREVWLESKLDPHATIMQCSTSMVGAFEAAGMLGQVRAALALVGGVESMSRVQIALGQNLSDWLRRMFQARSAAQRIGLLRKLRPTDIRLFVPEVKNRGDAARVPTVKVQQTGPPAFANFRSVAESAGGIQRRSLRNAPVLAHVALERALECRLGLITHRTRHCTGGHGWFLQLIGRNSHADVGQEITGRWNWRASVARDMLQSRASSGSDHTRAGSLNSAASAGARRGWPASARSPTGASSASLARRNTSANIAVDSAFSVARPPR
jgi:Thiolase, N-terminal domain